VKSSRERLKGAIRSKTYEYMTASVERNMSTSRQVKSNSWFLRIRPRRTDYFFLSFFLYSRHNAPSCLVRGITACMASHTSRCVSSTYHMRDG
jgi:hypothetical protein